MTIHTLQSLVPQVKAQFIETYPGSTAIIQSTDVRILSERNRTAERQKIFDFCKARFRDDKPNEGEGVIGAAHAAVILYAHTFKSHTRFKHVLLHELGHIYSLSLIKELFHESEADTLANRDTLIRSGMCFWSEFIAETIAYIADDADTFPPMQREIARMEQLIDEALYSGYLDPYSLAFYMAMSFENPAIIAWSEAHENQIPLSNRCDDEAITLISTLSNVLGQQWEKDDYIRIDRATLETVGQCVEDLWDYCSRRRDMSRLNTILSNMTH